ncbi:MAG: hypothetical protein EON89_09245 [Brevundimonas sp.]|nr:MAG: hypothetical protein EON89_09245 [Brevundimonas sp.]
MRTTIAGLCLAVLCLAGPVAAQDAVEAAYRAALAASPTPRALEADQRDWAVAQAEANPADRDVYADQRIGSLRARLARDVEAAAARPTLDNLLTACAPLGLQGCQAEGGWIRRGDDILFWQTQTGVTGEEGTTGAVVVLHGSANGPLTPIVWASGAFFSAPQAFDAGDGATFVALPGRYGGTGRGNADLLFRWTGEAERPLVEIDNISWRDDLPARLPPGLEVWKGVDMDYDELFAFTPLWREGDGNCCATGGSAILNFRIEGDRLVLDTVSARDLIIETALRTPTDVFDYVSRALSCQHWGGEEGYDAERRAQIEAAWADARCDAIEADGAALKTKYADDAASLSLIKRMEE